MKIVVGNWKMNGLLADVEKFSSYAQTLSAREGLEIAICPPSALLHAAKSSFGQVMRIGAQDCHQSLSGAHTGDISVQLLREMCCSYVIVGHSERRIAYSESNSILAEKIQMAASHDIRVIFCVGEPLEARQEGDWKVFLQQQMQALAGLKIPTDKLILAYEPIWAIGTGLRAEAEQIEETHAFLRQTLLSFWGGEGSSIPVIYGGSVKPDNVHDLAGLRGVDGALVGGASLKVEDFRSIVEAFASTL